MSPSYADTVKLVEDNYFHWEFNMRIKLSRNGLLAHIAMPGFDSVSDSPTIQWKTNDLKALGVVAGDVSLKQQVYCRGATTTTEARPLSGVEVSYESSPTQEKALATKKKELGKRRFTGKCFNCKKPGHTESEYRKKKADEEHGQVTRETSDFAFTATGAMEKSEWHVHSGACSHITSVRYKFVTMKELKMSVRITVVDGTKNDTVATVTVGLIDGRANRRIVGGNVHPGS
ncbi:unnamed protein product [Phytophthora fragariaefolia]|uniref:Unnamed protein product n=1 Tax=Phytophthora fragariaefolia TaxID=1490495 RepID=A0A9W7D2D8_9STRA|nr:unnamed protein product [Phytophthora fragariaefolia]